MNPKIILSGILSLFIIILVTMFLMGKSSIPGVEKTKAKVLAENKINQPLPKKSVDNQIKKDPHLKKNQNHKKIISKLEEDEIKLETLFSSAQKEFKNSSDFGGHIDEVFLYFKKLYGNEKADILIDLYSKYMSCVIGLNEKIESLPPVYTKDEILERIDFIKKYQEEFLGKDLYQAIYKNRVEEKKFAIEKSSLLNDENLYSYEKEEELKKLSEKYSTTPENSPKRPYDQYMESLLINKKDLKDLSFEDQETRKNELREKFFSKETLDLRQQLIKKEAVYDEKVKNFEAEKKEILSNTDLNEEDKTILIEELSSKTFSTVQKDRYNRNKAMEQGRKKLLKKYGYE